MKKYVFFLSCLLFTTCDHEKGRQTETGPDGYLCASEAVWSHGQGDLQNTGRQTGIRKQECYSGPKTTPQVQWTFSLGGALSANAPVIDDDGTIYLISEYPAQVQGGGVRTAGLLAINTLGNLKWSFTKSFDVGLAIASNYIQSPAIGKDGTIYMIFDSTFYALEPKDGTLKWSYHLNSYGSTSPVVGADGNVYAGADTIYCFDPNGTVRWKFMNEAPIGYCARIVLSKSQVICGFYENGILALDYEGNKKWLYSVNFSSLLHFGILVDENENYYFKVDSYKIQSLNSKGVLRWSRNAGQLDGMSELVIRGDYLYYGTFSSLFKLDKTTGIQDTVLGIFHRYFSPDACPLIDDDGVIYSPLRFTGCCTDYPLPNDYPQVAALTSQGNELWRIALPDAYQASSYSYLALSQDGTLYLATGYDGPNKPIYMLYAIK